MFTRPPLVAYEDVARTATAAWGLRVDGVEYAPVGFGRHTGALGAPMSITYHISVEPAFVSDHGAVAVVGKDSECCRPCSARIRAGRGSPTRR